MIVLSRQFFEGITVLHKFLSFSTRCSRLVTHPVPNLSLPGQPANPQATSPPPTNTHTHTFDIREILRDTNFCGPAFLKRPSKVRMLRGRLRVLTDHRESLPKRGPMQPNYVSAENLLKAI